MRQAQAVASAFSIVAVGWLMISSSNAAPAQQPCQQIRAACQQAGFVQGSAKAGNGLQVDCVNPIMQGTPPSLKVANPLPKIDPQLVTACKASNPKFGQGNAQPSDAGGQTPPASPSSPTAAVQKMQPLPPYTGPKRPNIVFVLADDFALNLVQFMPHLLQMQKEGATFTNYFVTDSLCCPSRSSIFTGRYPHDTGIFRNTGNDGGYLTFLSRGHEQETFAVALAALGYRASMSGKYLNEYQPAKHGVPPGWSEWDVAGNGYPEFNYSLQQDGNVVRYGNKPTDYLTDVVSDLGVNFIKQNKGAPFLIEIATFAPHAPYIPAPRDANAFPDLRAPRTPAFNVAPNANDPKWLIGHPALSDNDIAKIDKAFRMRAQSVLAIDKMIGELHAAITAIGEEKNTYFVFSSDNGYHMGEHRLMPGKMTAFDTDIHVPLIVTGPDVAAGRKIDEIAGNIDLYPTFAEIGGAAIPANVDGRSLLGLMHGQKVSNWRTVSLVEHHGPHNDPTDPDAPDPRSGNPTSYEAIRGSTFVYVEYADGEMEYHDLTTDPNELNNTFAALSNEQKNLLHTKLVGVVNCHSAKSCEVADHSEASVSQK